MRVVLAVEPGAGVTHLVLTPLDAEAAAWFPRGEVGVPQRCSPRIPRLAFGPLCLGCAIRLSDLAFVGRLLASGRFEMVDAKTSRGGDDDDEELLGGTCPPAVVRCADGTAVA